MVARTHASFSRSRLGLMTFTVLNLGGVTARPTWTANEKVGMFSEMSSGESLRRSLPPHANRVYEACYNTLRGPRALSFQLRLENKPVTWTSVSAARKLREGETYLAKVRVEDSGRFLGGGPKVQFLDALLYFTRRNTLKVLDCQSNWHTGLNGSWVEERSDFPERWLEGRRVKTALEFGGGEPGRTNVEFGGRNVAKNDRNVSEGIKKAFNYLHSLPAAKRGKWANLEEAKKRGAKMRKALPDLAVKYSFLASKYWCHEGDLDAGVKFARYMEWKRICSTDSQRVDGERAQCADVFTRTVIEVRNKGSNSQQFDTNANEAVPTDLYTEKKLGTEVYIFSEPTLREGAWWVGAPKSQYGSLTPLDTFGCPQF